MFKKIYYIIYIQNISLLTIGARERWYVMDYMFYKTENLSLVICKNLWYLYVEKVESDKKIRRLIKLLFQNN